MWRALRRRVEGSEEEVEGSEEEVEGSEEEGGASVCLRCVCV